MMQRHSVSVVGGLIVDTTTEDGPYYLATEVDAEIAGLKADFAKERAHAEWLQGIINEDVDTIEAKDAEIERVRDMIGRREEESNYWCRVAGARQARIKNLEAEANQNMTELCEARGRIKELEAESAYMTALTDAKIEAETKWAIAESRIKELTVALKEVQRLDKLTPKTDNIDIQVVVDGVLNGQKKPAVTKEIIKAGVSRGISVKDVESIDFGTGNFSIVIPIAMPLIKFYVTKLFICPVCGLEAEHHTNLDGPPENSPSCPDCFHKAKIPVMVLKEKENEIEM